MIRVMLIAGEKTLAEKIEIGLLPFDASIIFYKSPLKAIENYQDVRPHVVLYHYQDHPRHWKIGITTLRNLPSLSRTPFILLTEDPLPFEEANKASFLGVHAMISLSSSEENTSDIVRLREILQRRESLLLLPKETLPSLDKRIPSFVLRIPKTMHIIMGHIRNREKDVVLFTPNVPGELSSHPSLAPGLVLPQCSLRERGKEATSLSARILKVGEDTLSLHLLPLDGDDPL